MFGRFFACVGPFLLFTFNAFAQPNSGSTPTTPSSSDKVIFNKIEIDSLTLLFKDFRASIEIDSAWQKLLVDKSLYADQQNIYKTGELDLPSGFTIDAGLLKDQLKHLNSRTPIDIGYHPDLVNVVKYYLERKPEFTQKLMRLSQYYFPMFEEVFDKYDVPLELKYLAIVESALNPKAKSPVGATGLWQFMYQTGRIYDLEVNSYVDERMDPIKSTHAAAKYLRDLNNIFDDWSLALAAYNSGPGNVNKAIRRSGGQKNYWAIRPFLPRETAGYVPSYFALMYIFEHAEQYNLNRNEYVMPYIATDTIHTKSLIKLEQVAQITNSDLEFIEFLNPSYKLKIIPKDTTKTYTLRLPHKELGVYVANEEKIHQYVKQNLKQSKEKLPEYVKVSDKVRYRVRSGDYLGRIARRYGVRVRDIKRWNGLRGNNIRVGQRLTIYPKGANFSSASSSKSKKSKPSKPITSSTYVVKKGDSLWSIANKFNDLSVKNLKELNNLKGNTLKPGMVLKISA